MIQFSRLDEDGEDGEDGEDRSEVIYRALELAISCEQRAHRNLLKAMLLQRVQFRLVFSDPWKSHFYLDFPDVLQLLHV